MNESLVGQSILGYQIVAEVGSGAFGTVYKAIKSNVLGQYTRAVKHISLPTHKQYASILSSMGGDVEKTERYFAEVLKGIAKEIELLARLSEKKSAHIIRYYESDLQVRESPLRYDIYILMEYATPLVQHIEDNRGFAVKDVVDMGIGILEGIKVCHDNGVIHRDIKEDNIFVTRDGEYELGDFGVSKVLKDSSRAESLKGTPNYLAPEVYLNKGGYTKSVDLYSLGIVLYRLLNHGRNPFLPSYPERYLAEDEDRAFGLRMNGTVAPPPLMGNDALRSVVVKSIRNEQERYQDAESFLSDLKLAKEKLTSVEAEELVGLSAGATGKTNNVNRIKETCSTIRVEINAASEEGAKSSVGQNANSSIDISSSGSGAVVDSRENQVDGTWNEELVQSVIKEEVDKQTERVSCTTSVSETETKNRKRDWAGKSKILLTVVLAFLVVAVFLSLPLNMFVSCLFLSIAIGELVALLFSVRRSFKSRDGQNGSDSDYNVQLALAVTDAISALSNRSSTYSEAKVRQCIDELAVLQERFQYEARFGDVDAVGVMACEDEIKAALSSLKTLSEGLNTYGENGLERISDLTKQINGLLDKRRTLLRH
ncbi:serine/threonine protein kinase [Adlercreutzia sp. ZJ141]|uniref:serine/threonine protein kinase n=1 Tax=Adlercreutzia sp. ZJ141 TaxID=2709406 RepID=UPI0013ECB0AB|nr:serine/threonine-protein kinase [Adlercreutzia sp. ZJ141]